ncbi:hypothetical protein LSTR_LSTR009641 [Laodelphax striatellus]|uniref:RPGR-interacting protein 1 first C2 domain-containing protein n=1 Tax=Laodelphax striatellus TaxID=195883 RepID=A0A482WNB1_LAOST|nr:hypothetical protein LSTR_LSTR009641 [Laodelphax striatellus]
MSGDCPRIVAPSTSCDCVRPCSSKWPEKNFGMDLKQLSREELEIAFYNIHTKNECLSKALKDNVKQIKRLNKIVKKNEEDRRRCLSPTKQLYEDRISQLEQANTFLQDKVLVLRHQLQSHSRLHAKAHRNSSHISRSIHSTKTSQTHLSQLPIPNSENINRDEKQDSKEDLNVDLVENDDRISQLQNELDQNPSDAAKVAENIELIRLRRLVKRQASQLSTLNAHLEVADKELDQLRSNYNEASLENDSVLRQLMTEKQRLREVQNELIELGNLKQDIKILQEQVRDLQSERSLLRSNNDKLLEIASGKSEEDTSQQPKNDADKEIEKDAKEETENTDNMNYNDSSLLRKLISEEISKSPHICCNHCSEPNNTKITFPTTMRCQTIDNENSKIISLNCEPVPIPTICFIKCCQSSNPLPTTELETKQNTTHHLPPIQPTTESAKQETITTDVQCQTECFATAKESCVSIISYIKPVQDCCPEISAPQACCVSSTAIVCPQKVCAMCCCPFEEPANYCREDLHSFNVRNPPQKSCICTDNAATSCCNREFPLQPTQCMCSSPNRRTSLEREYGSKPNEIPPKRQMRIHMEDTQGILFKSQSTQVENIVALDDDRLTINGRLFKSCECGERAKSKPMIDESVKPPLNDEINRRLSMEVDSDPQKSIPASSTSESSIDSKPSRGKQIGWSKNSVTPSKKPLAKYKRKKGKDLSRNNKQQGTFTLWIDSLYFSSHTLERLNGMDTKPYVYLTWTFLELQDKAYSTIMPANKAIFNCSSVYRGDITLEMLHYMCANTVKVECHVALNDSSQMISFGEIDVSEAIYKPNTKCKYKVALDGPKDISAVISCWFKFDCPKNLLKQVLQD